MADGEGIGISKKYFFDKTKLGHNVSLMGIPKFNRIICLDT